MPLCLYEIKTGRILMFLFCLHHIVDCIVYFEMFQVAEIELFWHVIECFGTISQLQKKAGKENLGTK